MFRFFLIRGVSECFVVFFILSLLLIEKQMKFNVFVLVEWLYEAMARSLALAKVTIENAIHLKLMKAYQRSTQSSFRPHEV